MSGSHRGWAALAGVCTVFAGLCAGRADAQPAHLAPGEASHGAIEAEPPTVEVLTFGVGDLIFEKFGHAALCLRYRDPQHPAVCFNYGVTDFNEGPTMIWGFLRSHYLSNRVYKDYDELFEAIKAAWNRLEPARLKTLTHASWIERAA